VKFVGRHWRYNEFGMLVQARVGRRICPDGQSSQPLRRCCERHKSDRAQAIRLTSHHVTNIAEPTAAGQTLFLSNDGTLDLYADDARALHCRDAPNGGRA
jgi:hypothetical protein